MGRTLHYQVLNPEDLTDADLDALIAVSVAFNSGAFADAWTCENFFLEPMPVVPAKGGSWEQLQTRWDALQAEGLDGMALRRRLVAEGTGRQPGWLGKVTWHSSEWVRGFTKVGGNEWNAALVYAALLEISRRTPAVIRLTDEGEFLLYPVLIKGGKARPDREAGLRQAQPASGSAGLKALKEPLSEQGICWQEPHLFCRPVDIRDFAGRGAYRPDECLEGFQGEYWQAADGQAAAGEQQALRQLIALLGGKGVGPTDR
jgi:hypothetical protein